MKVHIDIPALAAPGREGLRLTVTRLDGLDAERLLLSVEGSAGSAILELGAQEGSFVFGHGKARLSSVGDPDGPAFVDAVAAWVGLEMVEAGAAMDSAPSEMQETDVSWVRLGESSDALGVTWSGFKLFLKRGERYAEVFFRLSSMRDRALLLEKWSDYRGALVDILEATLAFAKVRQHRTRQRPLAAAPEATTFGELAALELEIPNGWLLTKQPEGHQRLADLDDEMAIEFSYLRLPPLPPGAPDVSARLSAIIDASKRREAASPIESFVREDVTFAWSEYRCDSRDPKQPEAPARPARERWLVASNEWIQVLVTGCWWETDVAIAEAAWNGVIASLRLGGRIQPPLDARGDA